LLHKQGRFFVRKHIGSRRRKCGATRPPCWPVRRESGPVPVVANLP